MKNIFFLISFGFALQAISQPAIQWQATYGGTSHDIVYSVIQTTDGGYIAAGSSGSSSLSGHHGGNDILVVKYSAAGLLKWAKLLGGTGNEVARCVGQDIDGGYFIAGYSESNNFDVSGNHGGFYDGWFVKLDPNGNIQWQKTLGGSGWDDFVSAIQTDDHGYILTGQSENADGDVSYNHGFTDLWVVKLSQTGVIEWEKSYGGGLEESGHSINKSDEGGYIVVGQAGSTDGQVVGHHGGGDYWVIKISETGDLEWQKCLGGSGWDQGSDVVQTADGGYAVTGFCGSNNGDVTGHYGEFDFWVVMLDAFGNLKWEKSLGGTFADWGRAILATEDGGVIAAGTTRSSDGDVQNNDGGSEYWLVKLDKNGQKIWQQTYGGTMPEESNTFSRTSDGGLVMAGYAWSTDGDVTGSANVGKADFWIVKLGSESVGAIDLPIGFEGNIELYPNPVGESLRVEMSGVQESLKIVLTDMFGRQMLQQEIENGATVSLRYLKAGMYFASIISENGVLFCKKIEKI